MAALFERQRSGAGQVVDVAMVDGMAAMAGLFQGLLAGGQWRQQRGANLLDGGAPFYACYPTACGGHLAVAALEPKFFAELARRIGLDPAFVAAQHDRSRWPALREALTAIFRTRRRDDWCRLLEGSDACVAPVLSLDEAPQHPHALARGAYTQAQGVAQPAAAPRFSRSQPAPPRPAPQPGAHTIELLKEAGMAAAEIERLIAGGVAR